MRHIAIIATIILLAPVLSIATLDAGAGYWEDDIPFAGTEVWNIAGSPWIVNQSFNVSGTLQIDSGVEVILSQGVFITVRSTGSLQATDALLHNETGLWGGILFEPASSGTISGCTIRNASAPLEIQMNGFSITDTIIDNSMVIGPADTVPMVRILSSAPTFDNVTIKHFSNNLANKPNLELEDTPAGFVVNKCNISGGARAISTLSNANALVDNCTFDSEYALWMDGGTYITLKNSSNTAGSTYAARLDGNSHLTVINSTTTGSWTSKLQILDVLSDAYVYWDTIISTTKGGASSLDYVDINMVDDTAFTLAPETTDNNGLLHLTLREFKKYRNVSGDQFVVYSPYDVTASKTLHHTNVTNNVMINNHTIIPLELLQFDIDIIPSLNSLNLTGPGSTHEYGQEARIILTIMNIGSDDAKGAFAPQIYLYDNHTNENGTGMINETAALTSREILGNDQTNVTIHLPDILPDIIPGWHNISVHVDPNMLVPDNSRGNNNISSLITFRVNVPPQLNITPPPGNWNGTVNITGGAWDNSTDMDNLTTLVIEYSVDGGGYTAVINTSNYNYTGINQTMDWNFTYDTTGIDDGPHNLTVRVYDGAHSTNQTIPFIADNNQKPRLENVTVTPPYGNVTSNYTISVNYTDDDGKAPGGGGTPELGNITANITGPNGYIETINMTLDDPLPPFDFDVVELFTTGNFTLPENGTYTFHISAFDSVEWNETQNYTINVNNSVPVISQPYGANTSYTGDGDDITFYAWYSDADDEEPVVSDVTIDGISYTMSWTGATPDNYMDGVNYSVERQISGYGIHYYNFTFSDGNNTYTTETLNFTISTPPELINETMEHNGTGMNPTSEDLIYFNITYIDVNNDAPVLPRLEIIAYSTGQEITDSPFNMSRTDTNNYVNGSEYSASAQLTNDTYQISFIFSDGYTEITNTSALIVNNSAPAFSFTNITAMGNALYDITWTDHDIDDNATITFYYANNSAGNNWTPIVTVMEDDPTDMLTWDASALTQGAYYVFATIDDTLVNASHAHSTSTFVNHNPDVQDVAPAVNLDVNKEYVITWTANDTDWDDLTINLYYDSDQLPEGWTAIATGLTNTGTYTWNSTLVPDGYYYIAVRANDGSGGVYLTTVHSPATVHITHPIVSLDINVEAQASGIYAGENYNITGTATFSPDLYARNINIDIVETGDTHTIYLDTSGDFTLQMQAPAAIGNYTVHVMVEIDGDTWENSTPLIVTDPPLPDFGFGGNMIINPDDPLEGEEVTVQIKIVNTGSIARNANVALYVDDPAYGSSVDDVDVIGLTPGNNDTFVTLSWTSTGQGTHYLILVIDPLDLEEEEDETNNNLTDTVVVHVLADFALTEADIVPSNSAPTEGDNVSFTVWVHNNGGVTEDCLVLVYIDGSKSTPLYSGTVTVENGEHTEINVYWPSAERGGQILRVELDPENDVEEGLDNNNNAWIVLSVKSLPQDDIGISTAMLLVIIIAIVGAAALGFIIWQRKGQPPIEEE